MASAQSADSLAHSDAFRSACSSSVISSRTSGMANLPAPHARRRHGRYPVREPGANPRCCGVSGRQPRAGWRGRRSSFFAASLRSSGVGARCTDAAVTTAGRDAMDFTTRWIVWPLVIRGQGLAMADRSRGQEGRADLHRRIQHEHVASRPARVNDAGSIAGGTASGTPPLQRRHAHGPRNQPQPALPRQYKWCDWRLRHQRRSKPIFWFPSWAPSHSHAANDEQHRGHYCERGRRDRHLLVRATAAGGYFRAGYRACTWHRGAASPLASPDQAAADPRARPLATLILTPLRVRSAA